MPTSRSRLESTANKAQKAKNLQSSIEVLKHKRNAPSTQKLYKNAYNLLDLINSKRGKIRPKIKPQESQTPSSTSEEIVVIPNKPPAQTAPILKKQLHAPISMVSHPVHTPQFDTNFHKRIQRQARKTLIATKRHSRQAPPDTSNHNPHVSNDHSRLIYSAHGGVPLTSTSRDLTRHGHVPRQHILSTKRSQRILGQINHINTRTRTTKQYTKKVSSLKQRLARIVLRKRPDLFYKRKADQIAASIRSQELLEQWAEEIRLKALLSQQQAAINKRHHDEVRERELMKKIENLQALQETSLFDNSAENYNFTYGDSSVSQFSEAALLLANSMSQLSLSSTNKQSILPHRGQGHNSDAHNEDNRPINTDKLIDAAGDLAAALLKLKLVTSATITHTHSQENNKHHKLHHSPDHKHQEIVQDITKALAHLTINDPAENYSANVTMSYAPRADQLANVLDKLHIDKRVRDSLQKQVQQVTNDIVKAVHDIPQHGLNPNDQRIQSNKNYHHHVTNMFHSQVNNLADAIVGLRLRDRNTKNNHNMNNATLNPKLHQHQLHNNNHNNVKQNVSLALQTLITAPVPTWHNPDLINSIANNASISRSALAAETEAFAHLALQLHQPSSATDTGARNGPAVTIPMNNTSNAIDMQLDSFMKQVKASDPSKASRAEVLISKGKHQALTPLFETLFNLSPDQVRLLFKDKFFQVFQTHDLVRTLPIASHNGHKLSIPQVFTSRRADAFGVYFALFRSFIDNYKSKEQAQIKTIKGVVRELYIEYLQDFQKYIDVARSLLPQDSSSRGTFGSVPLNVFRFSAHMEAP